MQHYVGARCFGRSLKSFRKWKTKREMQHKRYFVAGSIEIHQGCMSRLSRLLVRNADVLHG